MIQISRVNNFWVSFQFSRHDFYSTVVVDISTYDSLCPLNWSILAMTAAFHFIVYFPLMDSDCRAVCRRCMLTAHNTHYKCGNTGWALTLVPANIDTKPDLRLSDDIQTKHPEHGNVNTWSLIISRVTCPHCPWYWSPATLNSVWIVKSIKQGL